MNDVQSRGAMYAELDRVMDSYRDAKGPLIQVLHRAQEIFGYLPPEVQHFVSQRMGIPPSKVHGVVTFYNFFRTVPQGKHVINICLGTACHVKGADRVVEILREELGIGIGQTTEDRLFTLSAVRCLGACGLAPVMMIDEEVYGKLDRAKIKAAVDKYTS